MWYTNIKWLPVFLDYTNYRSINTCFIYHDLLSLFWLICTTIQLFGAFSRFVLGYVIDNKRKRKENVSLRDLNPKLFYNNEINKERKYRMSHRSAEFVLIRTK